MQISFREERLVKRIVGVSLSVRFEWEMFGLVFRGRTFV